MGPSHGAPGTRECCLVLSQAELTWAESQATMPIFALLFRLDPEESVMVQPGPSSEPEAEQDTESKEEAEGEAVLMEEDLIQQSLDDYDAGKYSPRLLGTSELPFDAHVLEAEEDTHRLLLLRQQLQVTGRSPWPGPAPANFADWHGDHVYASGHRAGVGLCPQKRVGARSGAHSHSWPGRGMPPGIEGYCGSDRSRRWGSEYWHSLRIVRGKSFPAPSLTTKPFGLQTRGKSVLGEFSSTAPARSAG